MIQKSLIISLSLLTVALSSCGQTTTDKQKLGEANARQQLRSTLIDRSIHNVINSNSLLIKDKETAINVVEPILFSVYRKDNIIKQRPYKTYLIDNYWIVSGTLPQGYLGGTFLIILDATDSKIIRLTHGK